MISNKATCITMMIAGGFVALASAINMVLGNDIESAMTALTLVGVLEIAGLLYLRRNL